MNEPIAWWRNGENGSYSVWYENPANYGENVEDYIPLYEGWQEVYDAFMESIGPKQAPQCDEDGHFYAYDIPEYHSTPIQEDPIVVEEKEPVWSDIADAVREGINKV